MDECDSLEGWVAIKTQPFAQSFTHESVSHTQCSSSVSLQINRKMQVTWKKKEKVITFEYGCADATDHRAASYTLRELYYLHAHICMAFPKLDGYLPDTISSTSQCHTLLNLFVTQDVPDNIDELIDTYLQHAIAICGEHFVLSMLFDDNQKAWDMFYYESTAELRKRRLDKDFEAAKKALVEDFALRRKTVPNMLEMVKLYEDEDVALENLLTTLSELFSFQLQPFLDMREVAYDRVQTAKLQLEVSGDSAAAFSGAQQLPEWQHQFEDAWDNIHELTIQYYTATETYLKVVYDNMISVRDAYGTKTYQLYGIEREERLKEQVEKEHNQYLQARLAQIQHTINKLHNKLAESDVDVSYPSPPDTSQMQQSSFKTRTGSSSQLRARVTNRLNSIEKYIYKLQLEALDVKIEVLTSQEALCKLKMQVCNRHMEEAVDDAECEFHDAVDNVRDLYPDDCDGEGEDPDVGGTSVNSKVEIYRRRVEALNRRIGSISQRRAMLRNKKKKLRQEVNEEKLVKHFEDERYLTHHSIYLKREADKKEKEEKREMIECERQKTLERLRSYKLKYPTLSQSPLRKSHSNNVKTKSVSKARARGEGKVVNGEKTRGAGAGSKTNVTSSRVSDPVEKPATTLSSDHVTATSVDQPQPPPPPVPSNPQASTNHKIKKSARPGTSTEVRDVRSEMFELIRRGVKLRKTGGGGVEGTKASHSSDPLDLDDCSAGSDAMSHIMKSTLERIREKVGTPLHDDDMSEDEDDEFDY